MSIGEKNEYKKIQGEKMNRKHTKAEDVTLDTIVYEALLFNPEPQENSSEAAPIGSNTDGIIDPTSSRYAWASNLLKVMRGNEWGPEEVDMTPDTMAYGKLEEYERRGYDKAIAALIFNDSAQTRNLAGNMIPFITDGNIVTCLARQEWEEALHSISYDVMLKDVSPNRDEIYKMYLTDPLLRERDEFLAKMYSELSYRVNEGVSVRKLIRAMIANNILEAIMFYSGFILFWYLGTRMKGSAQMISFIARDERTHVLLFRQILTSTLKAYPGIDKDEVEEMAIKMVDDTVNLEIKWLKYITEGKVAAFNDATIGRYIHGKGDDVISGMGFSKIYNDPASPLLAYEKEYDNPNKMKTNFFEGRPKTYTATKLSTDGYL